MNYLPQKQRNPAGGPGCAVSENIKQAQNTTAHTWPKPGTIRAQILDALLAGRSLTSLDAWRDFGASRLAADVHELRRMGWPITASETNAACREGRCPRVATYRMGSPNGPA